MFYLYFIVMPALTAVCPAGLVLQSAFMIKPLWVILQWVAVRGAVREVRDDRLWREHYADLCACVFAQPDALLRRLRTMPPFQGGRTHPPAHGRIQDVESHCASLALWRNLPSEPAPATMNPATGWPMFAAAAPSSASHKRRRLRWRPGQA